MGIPRQVQPSPPASFPVYGLDETWRGVRWLELFGDALGDPVSWVSLGHQGPDGEPLVFVETHSRARTDARTASCGEPPLQHVAHYAAVVLVNVTLPVPSLPRPDGMLGALARHANERGDSCAQWAPATLRVDGAPAAARAWRFAGGWAAVSDAVDDVYLAVAGVGGDPDGLPLSRVRDGSAYHFRLDQPLHPDVMAASRAARGEPGFLEAWRGQWHDDQLRLLPGRA